jgi:circadian clock protein KaiB
MMKGKKSSLKNNNHLKNQKKDMKYHFRLFIAGNEPNSIVAKKNLYHLCENCLKDDFIIEIVDVLKDYKKALLDHIFVTPALIIYRPSPPKTIFGNLSKQESLLSSLECNGEP